MAVQSHAALAEIRDTLLETYASNDAMNQLILSHLDRRAWRAQEKRRAVPAHVVGCSLGRPESPRCKVLSRKLDANVARRRDHVRLHVLARGASSRSDFDAGPPARLPRPPQNSRRLALGEALETSRPYHAPAVSGTCPPGSSWHRPALNHEGHLAVVVSSWVSRALGC